MINCISVENMRQSDAYTIKNMVSSLELMHRAAYGVFCATEWAGKIAIVVGSGNNGGDGFALACILKAHGYDCSIFTVSQRLSTDSAYYAEKAKAASVPIYPFASSCLSGFSMIVDCLLGTGFQGDLRENYRAAMEEINAADAYVVSVDINSGMNGDTGIGTLVIRSDLTVTIGYVKKGLVAASAGEYINRLVCADIGIVLLREEDKICSEDERPVENSCLCPSWLDMLPIKAY